MLFNSYVFILLFFPLCMAGWFGLNHFRKYRLAQLFLFLMSLWFYGYFNPSYLPIILASIAINYAAGRLSTRPFSLTKAWACCATPATAARPRILTSTATG